MTQWEQLKTEYREIPVPENTRGKICAAVTRAKEKKARLRMITKYTSLVAAAMLVLFLMPSAFFRMGSKSAAPESAMQNKNDAVCDTVFDMDMNFEMMEEPVMEEAAMEEPAVEEGWFASGTATDAAPAEKICFTEEQYKAIEEEIFRQTGEHTIDTDAVYDCNNYYINEQGLYVFVTDGEEYIIPAEVVSP